MTTEIDNSQVMITFMNLCNGDSRSVSLTSRQRAGENKQQTQIPFIGIGHASL